MGQQQLLLIILVTILVGIATIIAINTMSESRIAANEDAVQQDMMIIINEAQAYYFRNEFMEGGGRSFNNIEMTDISIGDSTENGTYSLTGNGNSLTVEGEGVTDEVFLRANAQNNSGQLEIQWSYEK